MEQYYNAFISYRHHPDDIRVAQEIHKGLERFKVPKIIRKRNNGPMHLFRDKEELPITSHLTDDISLALKNSDYLIVICSPHVKESVWVQREIETFLKSHSRDKVLTVLAEGEPYDVIPEILLHEDVVDPLTGEIVRREIEPLSCDWRMKKRKAIREELPRLAAPLLHCAYDELRQRQRQYRMRRTIAAFSVALAGALALAAYYIDTSIKIQKANDDLHTANVQIQAANVKIQDNLDQALLNQSQYLASSSQERLAAGDRLKAIALAVEALPGEDNPRPYLAEAEYALGEALGTYRTSWQETAQGAYEADNVVKTFVVSQDGKTIYLLDERNVVTVWDVQTFQKKQTVDLQGYNIQDLYLTEKGNMLCILNLFGQELVCVDLEGKELWKVEDFQDIAFVDGGKTAMVLQHDYDQLSRILFLDPDTGKEVREPLVLPMGENDAYAVDFLQKEYESGQPVILHYYSKASKYYVALADPETNTVNFLLTVDVSSNEQGTNAWVEGAAVLQNGNVVIMRGDGTGAWNGIVENMVITGLDRADILCLDGKTGRLLWQSELVNYISTGIRVLEPIPDSEWVLLQNGNTFLVLDIHTGEQIAQCQTAARPLTVKVESQRAYGIQENGSDYLFRYTNNDCSAISFLNSTVDMAEVKDGFFIHTPSSKLVTAYGLSQDTDGVKFEGDHSVWVRWHAQSGDHLALKTSNILYMMDANQQRVSWSLDVGYSWEPMGFSADGSLFWLGDPYEKTIAAVSVADGEAQILELPAALGDARVYMDTQIYLQEDQSLYLLKSEEKMHLQRVDLNTNELLLDLPLQNQQTEEFSSVANAQILLATEDTVWVYRNNGSLYSIDLASGKEMLLAEELLMAPAVALSADQRQVMVGIGNEVHLTAPDGTVYRKISLEDRKAVSMYFYKQHLLVLCDDGDLYRYGKTGNLQSKTTLTVFDTFGSSASAKVENPMELAWWVTGDGDLILNAFQAGNIVDTETWQSRAFVPYLNAYVESNDTIVCVSDSTVTGYPRYSTQQLIEKAQTVLGDYRLSQEDRNYYGLDEE